MTACTRPESLALTGPTARVHARVASIIDPLRLEVSLCQLSLFRLHLFGGTVAAIFRSEDSPSDLAP